MIRIKNKRNFINKKPAATPTFCQQNFSTLHHIDFMHTLLSVPSLPLGLIHTKHMRPGFKTEALALTQSLDKINMVHLRKVSLAESWGSSRFFVSKISFIFHFNYFQAFGFETIIDGAKRGSVSAKIFRLLKLVEVNSI